MGITLRQLKQRLAELPDTLDDMPIYSYDVRGIRQENGRSWIYEMDLPYHYHVEAYLLFPVLGPAEPWTPKKLDLLHPGFRSMVEEKIASGEWPFKEDDPV